MSPPEYEDQLARQIRAIADMLARIFGFRANGQAEEAKELLEESYGLLLEDDEELIRQVDSATAALLLGYPGRILAYARLTGEEAEQEVNPDRRTLLRERAVELAIEAARRDPNDVQIRKFLDEASSGVDRGRLSPSYRSFLEGRTGA